MPALDTTFRARHLEVSFNLTVTTGTATQAGVAVTTNPVHRIRMRTFDNLKPTVGTLATAIDVRLKSGASKKLDQAIQDYAFNILRPRYRLNSGSTLAGTISFGSAEVKWYDENSRIGQWITSYALITGGWVQTIGENGYANQLIVSFRTGSGRLAKLVYMNGRDAPAASKVIPSGDAGIDAMVADAVGVNSPLVGLDGLPLMVGMEWNAGQNERLWKLVFRPN